MLPVLGVSAERYLYIHLVVALRAPVADNCMLHVLLGGIASAQTSPGGTLVMIRYISVCLLIDAEPSPHGGRQVRDVDIETERTPT